MTRASHPFLAAPRPRAFAHRGWHIDDLTGMENSLASFVRAAKEGYTYIETDVHATTDGVLVVHHDSTLRRVAAHPGTLRRMSWSELTTVRIGGREPLPRLEEVLEALPDVRFNVDLKSPGTVEPMLRLLERDDVAARVAVASTEEARLDTVRARHGDRVVTGIAVRSAAALRARSVVTRAVPRALSGATGRLLAVRGDLAQLPMSAGVLPMVDSAVLATAHALGIEVHVWTVDDPGTMHRLLDLGVDGLMTDRPDVLRDVLVARGTWSGEGAG